MKMKSVTCPTVPNPEPGTWTNAKLVGNQFFISGMTAQGDGSMYDQSVRTFQKIKDLVEAAGAKMNDIVELTIYVTDIAQRKEVWRARKEFFSGDFPCSTLVAVSALATPALLVEINATGFIGAGE